MAGGGILRRGGMEGWLDVRMERVVENENLITFLGGEVGKWGKL